MTGTLDVSPKIYLERLAAREAQIAARSVHVGHAGAKDGSHLGPNAASTYAFTFPQYRNVLTRHLSRPKTFEADVTGSTTGTANRNQGFSPIDLAALANDTLTPANTPTTANSIGLADESADSGYVAIIEMGTPPRTFNLVADSGSADLWVGAEGCVSTNGTDCVCFSPFCLSHTSHSGCRETTSFSAPNPHLRFRIQHSLFKSNMGLGPSVEMSSQTTSPLQVYSLPATLLEWPLKKPITLRVLIPVLMASWV
jgi:Eukaryotic aspartyl protease